MVLSVLVVLLLTVFYELLKVWRVWLTTRSKLAQSQSPYAVPLSYHSHRDSVLNSTPSETSLTPVDSHSLSPNTRNRSASLWNIPSEYTSHKVKSISIWLCLLQHDCGISAMMLECCFAVGLFCCLTFETIKHMRYGFPYLYVCLPSFPSDGCCTVSRQPSTFYRWLWATCWCCVSCPTILGSSSGSSQALLLVISFHSLCWVRNDGIDSSDIVCICLIMIKRACDDWKQATGCLCVLLHWSFNNGLFLCRKGDFPVLYAKKHVA